MEGPLDQEAEIVWAATMLSDGTLAFSGGEGLSVSVEPSIRLFESNALRDLTG